MALTTGAEPTDPTPLLLATDRGEIAVTREGPADALPIVCLHGIPGSSRDFRYLAPLLLPQLQVVRIEMPGFGSSPCSPGDCIGGWSQVCEAVADALELERLVLLGHSFGGGAALLAAARVPFPRLAGVVLISSMGARIHRGFGLPPRLFRLFATTIALPLTRRPAMAVAHRQYARRGLQPPGGDDWRVLHRQLSIIGSVDFAELGQAALSVQAPALICHAHDDRLVQHQIAAELAQLLPHARLVTFATGGHHLQKTRAQEIAREIACTCSEVP